MVYSPVGGCTGQKPGAQNSVLVSPMDGRDSSTQVISVFSGGQMQSGLEPAPFESWDHCQPLYPLCHNTRPICFILPCVLCLNSFFKSLIKLFSSVVDVSMGSLKNSWKNMYYKIMHGFENIFLQWNNF